MLFSSNHIVLTSYSHSKAKREKTKRHGQESHRGWPEGGGHEQAEVGEGHGQGEGGGAGQEEEEDDHEVWESSLTFLRVWWRRAHSSDCLQTSFSIHSSPSIHSFVDITSNQAQPLSNFLSHPTRPTTPSNSHWGAVRRLQPATPAKPSELGKRRREDTPVSAGDQTQYSVDLGD